MELHSVGNEANVRNYILWVMRLMYETTFCG